MKKSKLQKALKQRAKQTSGSKVGLKEVILSHHDMLMKTNDQPKPIPTVGRISFYGAAGLEIKGILEEANIIQKGEFVSNDYIYYPTRMEQMCEKLRSVYARFDVGFHFGFVDETRLTNQPKKPLIAAKPHALGELKQLILDCGPAAFFDREKKRYASGELIRTHPILFQDVANELSSISNTHEDHSHRLWENQPTLLGEQKIGDFEFLCGAAGSDTELPTVFILYVDKDGDIRGYVPRKGNPFSVPFVEVNASDYYKWDEIKQDILETISIA